MAVKILDVAEPHVYISSLTETRLLVKSHWLTFLLIEDLGSGRMTSSWLIVLLLGTAWTVQGNFIDTMEQAKDTLSQAEEIQKELYDELFDESTLGTEYDSDYDLSASSYDDDEYMYDSGEDQYEYEEPRMYDDANDDDSVYFDSYYDYLEDDNDVMLNETEISELASDIEDTLEQSLVGKCRRGTCNYCLKIWKLRLCAIARLSGNRLFFSIKFNRKTLFHRSIAAKGSYTIKINKRLFGALRHLMRSNLEIKLTNINIAKKRFCVQAMVRIRFFRRPLRVPRRPKCFRL